MTSLIQRFWNHHVIRVLRLVLADTCIALIILGSLEVIFWGSKRIEFLGYPTDRLAYFERVHFCSALSCFALFSVNLVIRMGREIFREGFK